MRLPKKIHVIEFLKKKYNEILSLFQIFSKYLTFYKSPLIFQTKVVLHKDDYLLKKTLIHNRMMSDLIGLLKKIQCI